MQRRFRARGIHPATGRVVEHRVLAPTEVDARRQAEEMGLERVTIDEETADTTPVILVVDDSESVRLTLSRLIRSEGYLVVEASAGPEALTWLRAGTPSLVITDFSMPGMDGVTLVSEIRKSDRHSLVPVIMFTACDGEVRDAAFRAGVQAFISKESMDWATLKREVAALAGPATLRSTLPDAPPPPRAKDAS